MARLNSLKSTFDEYAGWIVLLVTVYVLWCFRGLFSSVGGAAGDIATAATSGITTAVKKSQMQAKVKAATGAKADYTDEQLAQFGADAQTLAVYLGHSGFSMATVFPGARIGDAFSMMKQHYSRLNLLYNLPWHYVKDAAHKTVPKCTTVETTDSRRNNINYKVLVPFYKEITDGRDLVADFRLACSSGFGAADRVKYLKWIL